MDGSSTQGDASNAALYKVAYDESVRALAEQQAVIDSVRARVGLLLSAAAIATSFLGGQALEGGTLSATSWTALISYVDNLEELSRLATLFQIASGLLTAEVILWIAAIASAA